MCVYRFAVRDVDMVVIRVCPPPPLTVFWGGGGWAVLGGTGTWCSVPFFFFFSFKAVDIGYSPPPLFFC